MTADLHKPVIVTGGAGFIGSELVRQLAAAGRRVIAVDNLVNGSLDNLDGLPPDRVTLAEIDIRDDVALAPLMRDADTVFHLACLGVRHSLHDPRENHDVNATGTLTLLALAREARTRRFVYVSSSEVYGTAVDVPMTERHAAFPHTVYGGSKLAGECYARAYHDSYGCPVVVLRPFNAYGPRCHHEGDSGEVIPKFMLRCMAGKPMVVFGDGSQTRDFTFVSDTARGIRLAAERDEAIGQTLNLGFGREIPIRDLAAEVRRVVGRPDAEIAHVEPRPGDVLRLYADASRARAILNWSPTVSLDGGLRQLKAWYDAQGSTPEELLESEVVLNWKRGA